MFSCRVGAKMQGIKASQGKNDEKMINAFFCWWWVVWFFWFGFFLQTQIELVVSP